MLVCVAHSLPLQMACLCTHSHLGDFRDFGEYTSMQGEDYHIHQALVPFSNREITDKDMEPFKKESPLWAEKFPHIHTQEHLIKMGMLEAARKLVLGFDVSRDYSLLADNGDRGGSVLPCLLVQNISWTK